MSNVVRLPFLDLDRKGRGRFLTAAAAPTWARTIKIEKQKSGGLEKCLESTTTTTCVCGVCVCVCVCLGVYTFARFHYRSYGDVCGGSDCDSPCVGEELVVGVEDKHNRKRKSNTSFSCGCACFHWRGGCGSDCGCSV